MGHDATKVQMGTTRSNIRDVDNRKGTVAAGLIARLKTDGTVSVAAADGLPLGISLGRDLSDAGRTAVARAGLQVPVQLTASFTPTVGAQVYIDDTTGKAAASGTGKTGMNAIYVSGALTMVAEDGTETASGCALIDFPGGL